MLSTFEPAEDSVEYSQLRLLDKILLHKLKHFQVSRRSVLLIKVNVIVDKDKVDDAREYNKVNAWV